MRKQLLSAFLILSVLMAAAAALPVCAADERTWQEEYTVETEYSRTIYLITYTQDGEGKVTFELKKIENVMKIPYYNQKVGWGGIYDGTGDPMDPESYGEKEIVNTYYYNSAGDSSDACGPFSYAMGVSFLKGETILPTEHLNSDRWYNSLSTDYQIVSQYISPKYVKGCLMANKPVIYLCKADNGENCPFTDWHHYMILTGVKKDGTITLLDPYDFVESNYGNWEGLKKTSYIMDVPGHQKTWKLKKLKEYGILYIQMYNEGEKKGTRASRASNVIARKYALARAKEAEENGSSFSVY